jgi:L-asparaginase
VLFRRSLARPDLPRDSGAEEGLRVRGLETHVELVQVYTGMSDRVVRGLVERAPVTSAIRGLAVVAFGRGNVPPAIVPALAAAVDAGVLVTVSSRCPAGRVGPRYGYEGGGLQLGQLGAVLAGDLSGAKARLLQMVALGLAPDVSVAREIVRGYVN